jgi:hypothetical protein
LLEQTEHDVTRVALVLARVGLPSTPGAVRWSRLLRPHFRAGDYVAVAATDVLALVAHGETESPEADLIPRFTGMLEGTLGVRVSAARQFRYPDFGHTADEFLSRALAWAGEEREA